MVIQSSTPIIHCLPSLPCPKVYDVAIITINKSTKTPHKPTDKLYITCLLRAQLLCKIYIFMKKSKIFTKFCKICIVLITTQSSK